MGDGDLRRILIVDDDVVLMRVTREALTSFLKCSVVRHQSPSMALSCS